MEKETQLDVEKIKQAVEKAEKVDIDSLMKAFVQMLRVYAELARKIGTLQRDNKDAFEAIGYLGSIGPQIIQTLAKRTPPEELGAFIKAFMQLLEIAPKLDNIMKLSADEKIEVGELLEKIADTFDEMLKEIQEKKKGVK